MRTTPTATNRRSSRGNLRTKTGCLTCRTRRKKCDERTPVCSLCQSSRRQCDWPTSTDLIDRRHASHRRSANEKEPTSRSPGLTSKVPLSASRELAQGTSPPVWPQQRDMVDLEGSSPCLHSASLSHRADISKLEGALSRHFVNEYYCLLLLPGCHADFQRGWINQMQQLMVEHKSLHYSVLANAASHLHSVDSSSRMQELALTYYSNALRGLSKLLLQSLPLENHDGLLMSVMFLYLHGCIGKGTYTDITRHLSATIRILTLRLFHSPTPITHPFNRLAIESVMYQIFLVTTGLWSDQVPLAYTFDAAFWTRAEQLLKTSVLFPGCAHSVNSPVLGIPVGVYRLMITLKQYFQSAGVLDGDEVQLLGTEVRKYAVLVLREDENLSSTAEDEQGGDAKQQLYRDVGYLYILIASLLYEQISQDQQQSVPGNQRFPRPAALGCRHIQKAVEILRRYERDDEWGRCYIANWPVYTLGFFMSADEDRQLVRESLLYRWELSKFSQLTRYLDDLTEFWARTGVGNDGELDQGDSLHGYDSGVIRLE